LVHRSFGSIEAKPKDRPTFDLQGTYEFDVTSEDGEVLHKEGEPWKEEFTCLSILPAGVLDKLISTVSTTETGALRFHSLHVAAFLSRCLMPESRDRFVALLDDDARPVDFEALLGVMDWLAGPTLGRPTTPPSS
jgi:hypothetical protein